MDGQALRVHDEAMSSDIDLQTRPDPEIVAGFRDIDVVEFQQEIRQRGKTWSLGTIGTIVYLGSESNGCIVEIGSRGDLIDVRYEDLKLISRKT